MSYFELITDAQTGEQTIRPYTAQEIAAVEAQIAAMAEAARASLKLSFAQLMVGLVTEQWITEAEGEAWLAGTLPAAVLTVIDALPAEQRFAAKARALRPSDVLRGDPLVASMGAAAGKTESEIDDFFRTYAAA